MIEVRNLTKRFGPHTAVEDLSFTVEDGTIYGFLGPNGAGKSTTMNIMTGYLAATSGEVIINGHDIEEEPEEAKRTIGYLPEVPPVYGDMTVYEYLQFAAAIKKVPAKERTDAIFEAIDELKLEDVSDRLIRNISKGYRQRVGFAQALLGRPDTLILDEPMAGLDPRQITEIRDLIRRLGEKHTVILSSHILTEVAEICDKVLIINKGRLVACDTPEHLRESRRKRAGITSLLDGSGEALSRSLAKVPGIGYHVMPRDADGLLPVVFENADDLSARRALSRALTEEGILILGMHPEEVTLEKIFLELTGAESGEETGEMPEERTAGARGEALSADREQNPDDAGLNDSREGGNP